MLKRILEVPEKSFFLLGPRGSGKSMWLGAMFPDAHVIDLLSEETYQRLLSNPGQFADELRSLSDGCWVIVDEVQRLPYLLNEVHRFMEKKRLNFVLCGSSARKLKRGGVNLLAGRALRRFMHPFVPEELGDQFDLEEASVLKVAKKVLKKLGYTVLGAGTPGEAIYMARGYSGEINLLMTDVVMPEMNGKELAEEIATIRPNTKTLFMSGYTANSVAHQGILDKGVSFIQKPFMSDSLARNVREVLDEK